jgi:hypothetical protein
MQQFVPSKGLDFMIAIMFHSFAMKQKNDAILFYLKQVKSHTLIQLCAPVLGGNQCLKNRRTIKTLEDTARE